MKTNWQTKNIEDCIEKIAYTNKIQRKDFLESGIFPVISQEQDLINGYWNKKEDVFHVSKPVVVFGDHTQILKYVDFDFVLGADGVKLLQPKEFLHPRYFYYFLKNVNLRSLGYARHYRLLKEKNINYPESISEQERIVKTLDETFEKLEKTKENIAKNLQNSKELFESYLSKLDGETKPLGSLVDIKTGKLNANAMKENGQYPFFTCAKEVFAIDNYAFDCEAILLAGNNAVGDFNVKHYKGKFNAYQRTYVITVNKDNKVLYRYLYYQLLKSLGDFKGKSVGAGTKFLKIGMIQNLEIMLPSVEEQKIIVKALDNLSENTKKLESLYKQKLESIEELKKSILNKSFSKGL